MKKVAIITGASRGIGRDIAITLAKQNINVIANYNKSEKEANDLKLRLEKENISIDLFKADVSKRSDITRMIDFVINKYGRIDILINNAGIDLVKEFSKTTDDDWNNIINTNLYSAFATSQEVVNTMISQKSGLIINISSIWGLVGASCEVLYSVSKAGMDGLTKALSKELGPCNIRVNSIAPGLIDTDMNKDLSYDDLEKIKYDTPLGRIGRVSDISKCVKWLIDDEFTTGQVISINGGWVIN